MNAENFQTRVKLWLLACFGPEIAGDKEERSHRFIEEALELVQSCGCTASEAHQLVDYVFGRPVGEKRQEVGGVKVTLAALCLAHELCMHEAGETELARIWTKVEQIRAKQAAKPKYSPLPVHQAHSKSPAVAHLLNQMQSNPRLAYLIGPCSQSYELLTQEAALADGRDVAEFRSEFEQSLKTEPWPRAQDLADAIKTLLGESEESDYMSAHERERHARQVLSEYESEAGDGTR